MILIVVLGVCLVAALEVRERHDRFKRRALYHFGAMGVGHYPPHVTPPPPPSPRAKRYHEAMWKKYEYAWEHPWLPVLPDPPIEE